MKTSFTEINLIYPDEPEHVNYWTKKWGITRSQLHEAILETGSLRAKEIKNYLKGKKIPLSYSGFIHYIRLCV